jgi:hypothetical protein
VWEVVWLSALLLLAALSIAAGICGARLVVCAKGHANVFQGGQAGKYALQGGRLKRRADARDL